MAERRPTPPSLAHRLLEWRLPEEVADAIVGDLEEEYAARMERGDARLSADLWFWIQALTIRARALRRAAARVRATQPSTGRVVGRGGTVFWLDVKLGLRMVRKHPVMTAACVFALSVGIPASMLPAHVVRITEAPLPEDPEDRVRAIRYWDDATQLAVSPTHFELTRWRQELPAFEALAAYRVADVAVAVGSAGAASARAAEVTANAFEILGAVPLHGRVLGPEDERPGAPAVVVVGHDIWTARLGADPAAIGTTVRVAGVPRTIVGVMPEGFLFPARHQIWIPLTAELLVEPGRGRSLEVFGRLADGVSEEEAAEQARAAGRRMAAEFPATNARLVARVERFGTVQLGLPPGGWRSLNDHRVLTVLAWLLAGVACANVAMLVLARTATRLRELAIRASIGASRRRIVGQMFVESLVLALAAAGAGLVALQWLVTWLQDLLLASERVTFPPYWLEFGLTWQFVAGALVVAVLSASLAGVLPALTVTGTRVQESIARAQAGRTGIRFGGVTGALIVADVAIAVGVVGLAIGTAGQLRGTANADGRVGIPAHEYLAVEVTLPPEGTTAEPFAARVGRAQQELVTRLEAEPAVLGVAVADALPRQDHPHRRFALEGETSWLTVDGTPGAMAPPALPVARVDVGFFEALGRPILAGRGFGQGDLEEGAHTAIVNTTFVERRMGGRNPIGQRIRFWNGTSEGGAFEDRWYEIVGVVGPLGMNVAVPEQEAGVYLPAAPGEIHPLRLAVHVADDPEDFVPALRGIVSDVDAAAVLAPPRRLDRVVQSLWYFYVGSIAALAVVLCILVALAASGIYAIMSFAISERTREIGIRAALGESRASVAVRIARRSLLQIGLGALLGVLPAMALYRLTALGYSQRAATFGFDVAFAASVSVALAIGSLACLSPTWRALRIQPTEALKG